MPSAQIEPVHYCRWVRWIEGKLVAECSECEWQSLPCLTSEEALAHAMVHYNGDSS